MKAIEFIGLALFFLLLLVIITVSIAINQLYYTLLYLTLIEKKKIKGLKVSV